jgi:hypothetical protein
VLSLYKDIQERIFEEVDRIYAEAGRAGRSDLSFTDDFPKFRYLVAFMVCFYSLHGQVDPVAHITYAEYADEMLTTTSTR